ncbi:glycoside hydrolase family 2 protein [Flavobacterium sp. UMI-01]|uniref:glycoside hydrolase family 2 protein n=1 Tax=Flavobacterium sp. UMI-01 TaxID=1441053 RepID=UPI001C7CFBF3|nr:glycoside hydrolase family 2 protein [Flavobacterium sp. UMI-01]GIZ09598.1 beta-galactosidase [Flavobacterium sp. UMI-01]
MEPLNNDLSQMKAKKLFTLFILHAFLTLQAQIPFVKERNHINLTEWLFAKGVHYNAQKINFNTSDWQKVSVPHTYSMDAINGMGYYQGEAWYRTQVSIPEAMVNERVFIRFEAVGKEAQVYVNEKNIGEHKGGYAAFCYEITDFITQNTPVNIAVKVSNAPNFKMIPVDDNLFNHYGGMYRPVQIFSTPKTNISPTFYASSGVFVAQKEIKKEAATIEIRTHLSTQSATNSKIKYKIVDAKNQIVAQKEQVLPPFKKDSLVATLFEIKNPILWNGRKNPHLYTVQISLEANNKTDQIHQTFGLKTFEVTAEKGTQLNHQDYRLYGVAMHQEWKQTGPALSAEQHHKDMAIIDEIGATALRLSHYQHADLTYQLADEKGILVWTEIPFVHDYSGREQENAKMQLTELILQNYNHPSIFTWGLWNEVRAYNSKSEACVQLTEELNKLAHQLDPTRPTASASDRGIEGFMENITNLQAWNKYYGWYYGKYEDLGKWLDESHSKYPTIPLGISEYGAGGNIANQNNSIQDKPFGQNFPEMDQSLCHEISWKIIKDRPFVWGSFVWNIFDFSVAGWNRGGMTNLNHKGLVTYDRTTKKDAFYFYKTNWSKEAVLYIAERRNTIRKETETTVKVYTNQPTATLWLNGKKIATQKLTSDIKIIEFKKIKLAKGNNHIEIKAGKLTDDVNWILD